MYPTQAYLARIGVAGRDVCPYCLEEREPTGHFTNSCTVFHDACTKAHDEAWAATVAAFQPHMAKGLEFHHGVPMLRTKLQLAAVRRRFPVGEAGTRAGERHRVWTPQEIAKLRPDAVVVDAHRKWIFILEYTRPSDTRRHAIWEAAAAKTEKYQVLLQSLKPYTRAGWNVRLFPLP
eukprot:3097018-Rhodomonas_salina.1